MPARRPQLQACFSSLPCQQGGTGTVGEGRAGGVQRAGSPSAGTLDPQSCSSLGSAPCQLLLGGRGPSAAKNKQISLRNSLVVQWLGLSAFTAWVRVGELRSCKTRSAAKKKSLNRVKVKVLGSSLQGPTFCAIFFSLCPPLLRRVLWVPLFQPHQPASCSKAPGTLPPHDLCTCCSFWSTPPPPSHLHTNVPF